MMKHEFDELVGLVTAPEAYERIEFVYMNSDKFQTNQEIANFYKEKDMNGIEKEYKEVLDNIHRNEEFKDFTFNLAYFSQSLNCHIKQHLADTMYQIFSDKTIVRMLDEYRIRREEELQELVRYFKGYTKDGTKPFWDNHCLTNSAHYKTVIEDFTYRQWWHENADRFD